MAQKNSASTPIAPRPAARKAEAAARALDRADTGQSAAPGKFKKGVRELTLTDLDVMPPVRRVKKGKPVTIEILEQQIGDLLSSDFQREQAFRNEAIYDRVGIGLCLLKGRELHLQKGGRPAHVTGRALVKLEEKADQGFVAWIEEKFPGFSPRTARNYMNGARNAGLTADHSLDDVDALRTAQALHDKTAKELYRLADELKTPALPEKDAPTPSLIATTQRDLFASLDQMLVLREDEHCTPDVFEATTTRLQATLEKWTGGKWIMSESDDSAMHGHTHGDGRSPKKKTKSALTPAARATLASKMKARWAARAKKGPQI